MAVFLLKFIFSVITSLSSLLSRIIFTAAAHVLVQIIQLVKIPGEGGQRILDQIKDLITKFLEFLMDLIVGAIASVLSSFINSIKEGVLGSSTGLAVAMAGLLEKSKASFEDAMKDIPEVLDAFTQMVANIVGDILKNCSEAVGYVMENVLK